MTANVFWALQSQPGLDRLCAHAGAVVKKACPHDVPVFRLGRLAVDRTVQGPRSADNYYWLPTPLPCWLRLRSAASPS